MPKDDAAVMIVTQTTVRPDSTATFEEWQTETNRIISGFPGFLQQTMLPPSPPAQDYWVMMQRFADSQSAIGWLNAPERLDRLTMVQPLLTGRADVHVIRGLAGTQTAVPVSAIISTRLKPGCELAYRKWEQKIAVAQTAARGLIGYRFEPPIEGVQADWLTILRFDTQENLQTWLDSPKRQAIIAEAEPLTEGFHFRITRSGFDQWFPVSRASAKGPPVWKQNMVVLLMLFPLVFLFGDLVQVPLLQIRLGLPFAIALLLGNIASVVLLNWLVPWTSARFTWWLSPRAVGRRTSIDAAGAGLIAMALIVLAILFWKLG
jgi:antibiotic biosynthesis monooxygenase (ABM) superfamily enzyme